MKFNSKKIVVIIPITLWLTVGVFQYITVSKRIAISKDSSIRSSQLLNIGRKTYIFGNIRINSFEESKKCDKSSDYNFHRKNQN